MGCSICTDPTMATGTFGCHVQMLKPDDLCAEIEYASSGEIAHKTDKIREFFHFPGAGTDLHAGPVTDEQINYLARVLVGLDNLVKKYDLTGLYYYYIGSPESPFLQMLPRMIVGNSLLTVR